MEENTNHKKDLDAKGKQSAKKKVLMQEKKKKMEEKTSKFSVKLGNPKLEKEKKVLFYKNKYGYSTFLSASPNNSENIRIRKEALSQIPTETLHLYYEIVLSTISKENLKLLKKIDRCPPVLNLEDLTIRLSYPNQEECRKAIKRLNKEMNEILTTNEIILQSCLKADLVFFEVLSKNEIILFEMHTSLKNLLIDLK